MDEENCSNERIFNNIIGLIANKLSRQERKAYFESVKTCAFPGELLKFPERWEGSAAIGRRLEDTALVLRMTEYISRLNEKGIHLTSIGNQDYPELLTKIEDPPPALFYRGNIEFKEMPTVAIVGSREADISLCDLAKEFSTELSQRGACIISGLALGIDGAAHRGALRSDNSCPTLAVLGNGLSRVYPTSHERLALEIIERGGGLISQFEPGERAYPGNFLIRNRTIAGMVSSVIVIQASERSGSLVTARYALDEGRDVMVIPGDFRDKRFFGSNRLIKQGAYLVSSFDEVSEIVRGLAPKSEEICSSLNFELSPEAVKLHTQLHDGEPKTVDELSRLFEPSDQFIPALMELEINELVRRLPGNMIQWAK